MSEISEKVKLLREHGYRYYARRDLYVNSEVKKVFSLEWIEDNSIDQLRASLLEQNSSGDWLFYFNAGDPSPYVRQTLISEFA
ncbi:MAG: hypothetical protein AB1696_04940 [Planctomycetota bacterium]